jgi:hypothetical protein
LNSCRTNPAVRDLATGCGLSKKVQPCFFKSETFQTIGAAPICDHPEGLVKGIVHDFQYFIHVESLAGRVQTTGNIWMCDLIGIERSAGGTKFLGIIAKHVVEFMRIDSILRRAPIFLIRG